MPMPYHLYLQKALFFLSLALALSLSLFLQIPQSIIFVLYLRYFFGVFYTKPYTPVFSIIFYFFLIDYKYSKECSDNLIRIKCIISSVTMLSSLISRNFVNINEKKIGENRNISKDQR